MHRNFLEFASLLDCSGHKLGGDLIAAADMLSHAVNICLKITSHSSVHK